MVQEGVVVLSNKLASKVQGGKPLGAHSREEVALRLAAAKATYMLAQSLNRKGSCEPQGDIPGQAVDSADPAAGGAACEDVTCGAVCKFLDLRLAALRCRRCLRFAAGALGRPGPLHTHTGSVPPARPVPGRRSAFPLRREGAQALLR